MDINSIYMWLVRGFDGVVNLTKRMLDDGSIAGDGPLQHCIDMRNQLNLLIERMEKEQGK